MIYHDFKAMQVLDAHVKTLDTEDVILDTEDVTLAFGEDERALFTLARAAEGAGIPSSSDVDAWACRLAAHLALTKS